MTTVYLDAGHYLIDYLAEAITRAQAEGKSVRFDIDEAIAPGTGVRTPIIKYKIGEGMWSAPTFSQPDPNTHCVECGGDHGNHFLNCSVWSSNS